MKDKKKKIDQNLKHLSGSSSDVMCEVDMAPQWHQTFLGGECVCVCVCVCVGVWVCVHVLAHFLGRGQQNSSGRNMDIAEETTYPYTQNHELQRWMGL